MISKLTANLENYKTLKGNLSNIDKDGRKAVQRTVKDMKSRAPGWVASEVTKVYNIKKSEITPYKKTKKPQKKAGTVMVKGDTIESLAFVYQGPVLTPTHFGMKPTRRPTAKRANGRARAYKVTAQVYKGKTKALGASVFLASSGGAKQIPFQREGAARLPILAVKTVSMPQTITNEQVNAAIHKRLNKGLEERFTHQMKQVGKSI